MRILITTGIFVPEIGGPATYVAKLSQELVALGHEVTVLTYSDQLYPEIDGGLPYQVIRIIRTNKFKNYWNYFKKIKEINTNAVYNLVYCFDHLSAGLPAVLANIKFKRPLFIRVGGDFIWERYLDRTGQLLTLKQFYNKKIHLKEEKIRWQIIKWVFSRASKIIFTTEFQEKIFLENYKLRLSKLAIVKNPTDKQLDSTTSSEKSKEIIFAGRFITKNNIKNLIIGFDMMSDSDFSLHLIGEGPLVSRFQNLILKYDNVYIENKLSNSELIKRLQQAYLVVFPALTDISPNTMLDCLAHGVPFISSQEIGFDWLKDNVITFDPLLPKSIADCLNSLSDPEAYSRYLKRLESIDYQYSYHQAAVDTLALLEKL